MKIFMEGGGQGNPSAHSRLRTGFGLLLTALGVSQHPRIVACGPRGNAFRKFSGALARGEKALLLVDSESPVTAQNHGRPWAHLAENDKWTKPAGASDDDAHLMVQCMESWFVADPDALAAHFGRGFNADKLPGDSDVEEVVKSDILGGLEAATKKSGGGYRKVRDGFALIGIICPFRVAERAPHAKRFFDALRQEFGARKGDQ